MYLFLWTFGSSVKSEIVLVFDQFGLGRLSVN